MEESKKKLIFSADDFAKCEEMDVAILKGFQSGILTSTCIMANGENYDYAVNVMLPKFPDDFKNGGLGCHLNIIEGKSLLKKSPDSMLCNKDGVYNKGFIYMLIKSYNKKFMNEVEEEFRSQIEKLISDPNIGLERIDHINSHVHTHSIPKIFELTCRLASEYGIKSVRTQKEPFYTLPLKKYKEMGIVSLCANVIKNLLLKFLSLKNVQTLQKYELQTNNNFIGLLFTGFMDEESVLHGLNAIQDKNSVTEVLVHPYFSEEEEISVFKKNEFLLTQNTNLREEIVKNGFCFTKFVNIS